MKLLKSMVAFLLALLLLGGCAKVPRTIEHLPVLLYHHIVEQDDGSGSVTVLEFEAQMSMLRSQGYTPISLKQLIDFAEKGAELPDSPVIITFDNGYFSNYEHAFPVLQQNVYPATIFAIGSSIEKTTYKNTDHPITPHFGKNEITEMVSSGLISIQSHTYDMHQWPPFETGNAVRETVLPLEGESEEEYTAALLADHRKAVTVLRENNADPTVAVAFPHGKTSPLTTALLRQEGIKVTFTTDAKKSNTVTAGDPDSLYDLGRMNIAYDTTNAEILNYLKK